ncbi:MAG: protein-export chaperone SecB [Betaproteobacteria bacterium]|nr:protein-export chaperone SecB [Betaproteobacteria bacterium]
MSEQQPVFSIEKVYVKDLSLEIPNAPQIFLERENPKIDVQLETKGGAVQEGFYETQLTITVTATLNDKTLFLVEATQAGIFQIRHIPAEELDPILGVACPNILFPYAREVISDMVTRAGFPPVLLNPMNFEALYQQRAQEAAEGAATTH